MNVVNNDLVARFVSVLIVVINIITMKYCTRLFHGSLVQVLVRLNDPLNDKESTIRRSNEEGPESRDGSQELREGGRNWSAGK